MNGHIMKTSGETVVVAPQNGEEFSVEELKTYVGGELKSIDLIGGDVMYVNKGGKNLPLNEVATHIVLLANPETAELIMGDIIFVPSEVA